MISTEKRGLLPDWKSLQKLCKAIATLDAIICQEWEYRYYSYNAGWSDQEEFFEMRNGCGDQMLILFRENGCVINGFAHELYDFEEELPAKENLTEGLPKIFQEFVFGEPVQTIGTTFCLWTTELNSWQIGKVEYFEDGSEDMLHIFDGNPQTYIDWATDYFEENCKQAGISFETVNQIYSGKILTKEMVLSIVDELEDWEKLKTDLIEIGYLFDLN